MCLELAPHWMNLKEFTLISPVIESAEVLTALQTAIPPEAIDQTIGRTDSQAERNRALPTHLVVCLVIGMSLWAKDSMRSVLKNLVDGLSTSWVRVGQYWRVPCKSSITEARLFVWGQGYSLSYSIRWCGPNVIPT